MSAILVMAPQTGQGGGRAREIVGRMVALADKVASLSYGFRYLAPENIGFEDRQRRIVDEFEARRPEWLLRVPVHDECDRYFVHWPKDGLQTYRHFTAVAPIAAARHVAEALGLLRISVSGLCEGGLFVRSADLIVASSAARSINDLRRLRQDYRLFFLPQPFSSPSYRLRHPASQDGKTHLDLDFNLVRSVAGTVALLVGTLYYAVYRDRVRALAERLDARLHVVPFNEVERRALNLVALPNGEVVIPGECTSTRQFLRCFLGADRVLEAPIVREFGFNGGRGGLACMSSLLEMPASRDPSNQ